MTAPVRLCECGCGEPLTGRPNAVYATAACRTRAWKDRTGYVDPRRRKASRNATQRRPTLRISYRRAIEAVAPYVGSAERAEFILRPLLSAKARGYA